MTSTTSWLSKVNSFTDLLVLRDYYMISPLLGHKYYTEQKQVLYLIRCGEDRSYANYHRNELIIAN